MTCPGELKYHLNGREDAMKFFYVYENVFVSTNNEEEKADRLVTYLDGEAFEYYIDNFTEDNGSRSFQKVSEAFLEKFSSKKIEAKVMKGAVDPVYKESNVKEFFVKANKLYKEAKFNDQAKFGSIDEAIKSD